VGGFGDSSSEKKWVEDSRPLDCTPQRELDDQTEYWPFDRGPKVMMGKGNF
jgi:hypothetical protein